LLSFSPVSRRLLSLSSALWLSSALYLYSSLSPSSLSLSLFDFLYLRSASDDPLPARRHGRFPDGGGERDDGLTRDAAHPGATCWVTKPLLRIDYAFLSAALAHPADSADATVDASDASATKSSEGLKAAAAGGVGLTAAVRGYQRVLDDASDHLPVVVDLALRAAAGDCGTDSEPDCN
jgi:hypothetical protein